MDEILFAEQVVEFGLNSEESTEYVGAAAGNNGFEVGSMYTVVWDGTTYECECVDVQGMSVIGNTSAFTGTPSDIPFLCYYDASEQIFVFGTEDTSASHTVAIYKGALDEEIPGEEEKVGANIVLFDRNGNEVTYEGIETVTFNTDVEGETATYTHGTVPDEVPEVAVDFTDGNQIVNAETGKLIKSVVIKKPETLLAENIKKGVEVAGVLGEFIGNEMEKTAELAMADGDQVIEADADTVMKKVTVKKPETLIPENILDGVNIGEVVGNHKDKIEIENMEIELDVSEGDQLLSAPEGYVVKTAVIKKPETMIPENIKKNTSIAGVMGILNSIEDVATVEEMDELLVEENIGNAYRFVGETTENYINGDIYVVEDNA